jgi:glycosyltransferase involved in cell wall biosynthesis
VIQYQDPLFRRLAAHPELDLTVLFCSSVGAKEYLDHDLAVSLRWDLDMLYGYNHRFVGNLSPMKTGLWRLVNPAAIGPILSREFDAVLVMGWGYVTTWLVYAASWAVRVPFLIAGDSSVIAAALSMKQRARKYLLGLLFSRAAGLMVSGARNREFYRHYGAGEDRFFPMPLAIDNERFFNASRMTQAERDAERRMLGIEPTHTVILYSGKLIARKNPLQSLEAYERMKHRDRTAMIYAGEGVERGMLEEYVRSRHLDNVHFLGFVNQRRIPEIYGISDVLVLPSSHEPWGLVVNEAMACGLPVVVSDKVGACGDGDIVRDGENGFIFRAGDIGRLAEILDTLAFDAGLVRRMGMRSLEIIQSWSFNRDVDGIVAALEATLGDARHGELAPSHQFG